MGWGGVGWDVNVHWHHKYVMLRHCPFFCNFHTDVMLRWGGVGWDVNVHWHFHKYVMLRLCPFFCNFHTYVMLRWGGEGWGGMLTFIGTSTSTWCYATARSWNISICQIVPMALGKPTRVVEDNCGVHQATVLIRLRASWRKKTLRGLSMEKLNPQVRRPLFLHQNWRFAMAKPWICANYSDGKNSAGMFMSMFLHVSSCFFIQLSLLTFCHRTWKAPSGPSKEVSLAIADGKTGKGLCTILINSPISQCGRCCTSRLRWSRTKLMAASSSVAH